MKTLTVLTTTLFLLAGARIAPAQDAASILKPPKGATVAIVVFEDLECPVCRRDSPLVTQAGKTYKIPVVRHDFPLAAHKWSHEAAVMAHFFDSRSKSLGVEFREYIFEHQPEITPENLRSFGEKFAAAHKMDLPFVIDPQGKFAAEVAAERELGIRVGIQHTPTVYVVSSKPQGKPFIEVEEPRSQLFQTIDAMEQQ
ncbi:MAG: thioredoxin domain-containing protein [Acidobacteriales bacterium]|nr:thioredoxin domain-containing protein [Terriglobales bacterium]